MNILFFIILLFSLLLFNIANSLAEKKRLARIKETIHALAKENQKISAKEFMQLHDERIARKKAMLNKDLAGIYIIHNLSKDMYYVGQAKKVFRRLFMHFNGSGNGDVYADYKFGDEFDVQIIPLYKSGYSNLDDLERHTIYTYDAYRNGYNRNKGIKKR